MKSIAIPSIYFGDWLKAAHVLEPADEPARRCIAALLQLDWQEEHPREPPPPPNDPDESPPSGEREEAAKDHPNNSDGKTDASSDSIGKSGENELPLLEPESSTSTPVVDWLSRWNLEDVAELSAGPTVEPAQATAPAALVPPNQLWSVVSVLCTTARRSPQLDLTKILRRLVRLQVISALPRRPRRDLAAGLQLLIDRGEGMMPFFEDQESVRAGLRRWVGRDGVDVVEFRDDPGLGVYRPAQGKRGKKQSYRLPAPGTPIMIIGDAGQGPGEFHIRARANWLQYLALQAKRQNSRVILLTPLPISRCPDAVRGLVVWLIWDRDLTSRMAWKQLQQLEDAEQPVP